MSHTFSSLTIFMLTMLAPNWHMMSFGKRRGSFSIWLRELSFLFDCNFLLLTFCWNMQKNIRPPSTYCFLSAQHMVSQKNVGTLWNICSSAVAVYSYYIKSNSVEKRQGARVNNCQLQVLSFDWLQTSLERYCSRNTRLLKGATVMQQKNFNSHSAIFCSSLITSNYVHSFCIFVSLRSIIDLVMCWTIVLFHVIPRL